MREDQREPGSVREVLARACLAEGGDPLLDGLRLGEILDRREQRGALPHLVEELSRHALSLAAAQDAGYALESLLERARPPERRLRPELTVVGRPVGEAHAELFYPQRCRARLERTDRVRRTD